MNTKTLYITVFILAAIALVVVIYDRKNIAEINAPVIQENIEAVVVPQESPAVIAQPVSFNQAITVISVPQKKEQVIPIASNEQTPEVITQASTVSSKQSSVAKPATSADSQEPAGVTVLKKYPTKEEAKEMNARGIVIY